jgi:hypothetical protein
MPKSYCIQRAASSIWGDSGMINLVRCPAFSRRSICLQGPKTVWASLTLGNCFGCRLTLKSRGREKVYWPLGDLQKRNCPQPWVYTNSIVEIGYSAGGQCPGRLTS